jgi:hypothetical protein
MWHTFRMTMQRTKKPSSRRSSGGEKTVSLSPLQPSNWKDATGGKPDGAFMSYTMAIKLVRGSLLKHPDLGKGVVFEIEGNKAHVLFEEGVRKLMHSVA